MICFEDFFLRMALKLKLTCSQSWEYFCTFVSLHGADHTLLSTWIEWSGATLPLLYYHGSGATASSDTWSLHTQGLWTDCCSHAHVGSLQDRNHVGCSFPPAILWRFVQTSILNVQMKWMLQYRNGVWTTQTQCASSPISPRSVDLILFRNAIVGFCDDCHTFSSPSNHVPSTLE